MEELHMSLHETDPLAKGVHGHKLCVYGKPYRGYMIFANSQGVTLGTPGRRGKYVMLNGKIANFPNMNTAKKYVDLFYEQAPMCFSLWKWLSHILAYFLPGNRL